MYIHSCATFEMTYMNPVTRSTEHILHKLHFMLLAYITEQIWLPHCKYTSHCPHSVLAYRSSTGAYMCQTQQTTCSPSHYYIFVPDCVKY